MDRRGRAGCWLVRQLLESFPWWPAPPWRSECLGLLDCLEGNRWSRAVLHRGDGQERDCKQMERGVRCCYSCKINCIKELERCSNRGEPGGSYIEKNRKGRVWRRGHEIHLSPITDQHWASITILTIRFSTFGSSQRQQHIVFTYTHTSYCNA